MVSMTGSAGTAPTVPEWARGLFQPELEQLALRGAQYTEKHLMRGMFFTSTLECLRRARGEEAVKEAVRTADLHVQSFTGMRNYPLSEFNKLRTVVGAQLQGSLGSTEAAIARVAGAAVEIFFESIAGRTMVALAGNDPHRLMGAAPNAYKLAVDDFAARRYQRTAERTGTFTFQNDLLGPCHQYGTFHAAITAVCGIDLRMQVEQGSLAEFKLHVSW